MMIFPCGTMIMNLNMLTIDSNRLTIRFPEIRD